MRNILGVVTLVPKNMLKTSLQLQPTHDK